MATKKKSSTPLSIMAYVESGRTGSSFIEKDGAAGVAVEVPRLDVV